MTVPEALSWSSNAAAVQTINLVGTQDAYNQATSNLGFSHLAEADAVNLGALSIGGMEGGVTVREMAAAIGYIGNNGLYYQPYTYYYVTDANGNIILDNRNNKPIEAYTKETAYKMNRLLRYNVLTSTHSASQYAQVDGWDIVGKTGTTDNDYDIWFVGASPYCTLACWMGYDQPATVPYGSLAAITWQKVMKNYLADKPYKEFEVPDTIIPATYCKGSGLLAASYCSDTGTGYYTAGDMPDYCDGIHKAGTKSSSSSSSSSSEEPSEKTSTETSTEEETSAEDETTVEDPENPENPDDPDNPDNPDNPDDPDSGGDSGDSGEGEGGE